MYILSAATLFSFVFLMTVYTATGWSKSVPINDIILPVVSTHVSVHEYVPNNQRLQVYILLDYNIHWRATCFAKSNI